MAECISFKMQVYNQKKDVVLVPLLLGYDDYQKQNFSWFDYMNN